NCRIAIWSNYYLGGMRERVRFLRVGTLDNPDLMPPDVHIYTSTKMPWFVIPPDDYAVEEFYDLGTTWSKKSQERWKKATK
ncbi:MAG: aldehyde-activating protein, partial [Paracoccaceae bacterium]